MKSTSQKILYLTQRFRPDRDAPSKEVHLLVKHFQGQIHDLHLEGYAKVKLKKEIISYPFLYYPLGFFPLYLASQSTILHLYTSFCDRPYLPFLPKERMIVSSSNFFRRERLKERIQHLKKVNTLVIQSEVQREELLAVGIDEKRIELVYPAIDVETFSYASPKGPFTILNASCPGKVRDLEKRGIHLLLEADAHLTITGSRIKLLWRQAEFPLFQEKIKHRTFQHLSFESKIHTDMNQQYAQAHATLIPYVQFDEYLKLVPTTVMESLAAGKPVLVSSQTGVAEIIKEAKCGIVFEPTLHGLLRAITELKKNYKSYQRRCRGTAERYFSKEIFFQKYAQIYKKASAI